MLRRQCPLFILSAMTLLLVACAAHKAQPSRPQTHPQHVAATPKASGKASRSDALAPGEVGYYFDVLQGRLQQSVDPAVIVGRSSSGIALDFSRRIGFASGEAQLDDAARALLAPLSKVLAEYRMTRITIRISADDDTAEARTLARQRASAIVHVLEDSGIAATRIRTSTGEAMGRAGDAHVEVELAPLTRGE